MPDKNTFPGTRGCARLWREYGDDEETGLLPWGLCAVSDGTINSSSPAGGRVSPTHRGATGQGESGRRSSILLERSGKACLETLALDGQAGVEPRHGEEERYTQTQDVGYLAEW